MRIQFRDQDSWIEHNGKRRLGDIGFTLVHPFYNERQRFELHYEMWQEWPAHLRDKIRIVLIDDGSPSPVHKWITPSKEKRLGYFNISIYRIREDILWNTPGALNLGFVVAPTEFVLCMDSDCAFAPDQLEKFLEMRPHEDFIYKFPRKRIGTVKEAIHNERYLPCSNLLHKNVFMAVSGFDEAYTGANSGGYGFFDCDFDWKAITAGYEWGIWHDVTATEWMPSACGPAVQRRNKHHAINKRRFYKRLRAKEFPITPILQFSWERTFHKVRP